MLLTHERVPSGNAAGIIEAEERCCSTANRRKCHNSGTIPTEVILPAVGTRIEEEHSLPTHRINRSEIWTLVAIALMAGIRQILEGGYAAMLDSDDVIGFVRNERRIIRHTAVFAASSSALAHLGAQGSTDALAHAFCPVGG